MSSYGPDIYRARFREAKINLALRKRMKLRLLGYGLFSSILGLLPSLVILKASGVDDALSGLSSSASTAGLSSTSLNAPQLIGKIIAVVLGFTGTIFFILVVWAGLTWMTAAGNEESIKKAQSILKTAIIGLVIVLSAYAITKFIGSSLQ